jgi:hypothetical protein
MPAKIDQLEIPRVLQAFVRDTAIKARITPRAALEQLVREAGSLDALIEVMQRRRRKSKQKAQQSRLKTPLEPAKSVFDSTSKKLREVQGGAPGLGGQRKQLRVRGNRDQ